MKIIILKRDKLGDLLISTPALQMLRELLPNATISVVAPSNSSWILKEAPFIDKLYSYSQSKIFSFKGLNSIFSQIIIFLQLRFECYDFAIAAGGEYSKQAVKRLKWIGAKKTISFVPLNKSDASISYSLNEPKKTNKGPHECERIIELLKPLISHKKKIAIPDVWFQPPAEWISKALSYLKKNKLTPKGYIIFGLGARREKKQASKTQIIETAKYAYQRHGLVTILVWTPGNKNNKNYPGDDNLAEEILKDAPSHIFPLRAPLDLTIGIIWLAKKSIFPDSGLMHFAAASPSGVIGLFADTEISPHPKRWGPLGKNSCYLEAKRNIKDLGNNFLHKKIDLL
jgi:ADP-heptose:LPS heptosyltransferase